MVDDVISVLTRKPVDTILSDGGTQSWALDRARAKACKYVIICRNARTADYEGLEAHGSAFMVGKISDVVPSTEPESVGRWLILLSEYALCDYTEQWEGRNPVAYWTTDDYEEGDVNFDSLIFQPMPVRKVLIPPVKGLTIAEAKAGLSVSFGVTLEAIEITIRG